MIRRPPSTAVAAALTVALLWSGGVHAEDLSAVPDASAPAPAALTPLSFDLRTPAADSDAAPGLALQTATAGLGDAAGVKAGEGFFSSTETGVGAQSAYGPGDQTSAADIQPDSARYRSFGSQVGSIKTEVALIAAYYAAINGKKLFDDPVSPHFQTEGYFGINTRNVGVDKLAHAYSSYVVSEILYSRLKRNTGNAPGIQFTAAALGFGASLFSEFSDSIEPDSGWSWEDVSMNAVGAGFSILRNSVPGLDRKLDYRLMIVPNSDFYKLSGKTHFEQQRYFFALKLSGFDQFEKGPLRFLELHLGYRGKDFTNAERAAGVRPQRRIFVGFGVNLRELFFKDSGSRIGRAVGEGLDYFQPPYTAFHRHVTR